MRGIGKILKNLIHSEILPDDREKIFNFKNTESDQLYQQTDLPDLINNYFSEIGPKLAKDIPRSMDGIKINGDKSQEVFELRDFTIEELLKCVKDISVYKSSGMPDLSTRFLKDALLYIPNAILYLYNRVKITGIFPDA